MGKSHPMELRSRVIAFVEEGHGHREAARHFRVSPRFVNDMVILKRASGGLLPKRPAIAGSRRVHHRPPYSGIPSRWPNSVPKSSTHCSQEHRAIYRVYSLRRPVGKGVKAFERGIKRAARCDPCGFKPRHAGQEGADTRHVAIADLPAPLPVLQVRHQSGQSTMRAALSRRTCIKSAICWHDIQWRGSGPLRGRSALAGPN